MHGVTRARNEYENALLASLSSSEKLEILDLIRDRDRMLENLESSVSDYESLRKAMADAQSTQFVDFLLSAVSLAVDALDQADAEIRSEQMHESYSNLNERLAKLQKAVDLVEQRNSVLYKKIEELGKRPPVINNYRILPFKGPSPHKDVFTPPPLRIDPT